MIEKRTNTRRNAPKRVRRCPFKKAGKTAKDINWKDVDTLGTFVTPGFRMIGRKTSGVNPKCQKALTHAIKRARLMALMPFTVIELE